MPNVSGVSFLYKNVFVGLFPSKVLAAVSSSSVSLKPWAISSVRLVSSPAFHKCFCLCKAVATKTVWWSPIGLALRSNQESQGPILCPGGLTDRMRWPLVPVVPYYRTCLVVYRIAFSEICLPQLSISALQWQGNSTSRHKAGSMAFRTQEVVVQIPRTMITGMFRWKGSVLKCSSTLCAPVKRASKLSIPT